VHARTGTKVGRAVKPTSSLSDSEVTHPFIRALVWHRGAGAREDPKEEQRPLEDGSHVRPDINARLLLQLDDLTGLHRGAGAGLGGRVRHGLRAPGSNASRLTVRDVLPPELRTSTCSA